MEPRVARGFGAILEAAWRDGLQSGLVAYDPGGSDVEHVDVHPFRFHYLPQRSGRPGARQSTAPPPEGLRLAHETCPFDEASFVPQREVARLRRHDRLYHLVANRYPVTPLHFLPVRSADAHPRELNQQVHGPHEIEDLLLILAMAGAPFHIYFNSNRGADNSQSGSSVNHWHGQLFPLSRPAGGLFEREAPVEWIKGSRPASGRMKSWPARHILVEASVAELEALAQEVWRAIDTLNRANSAYNFEAAHSDGDRIRAFVFPRRPAADARVPGAGSLNVNFGGWELSGDIVIPTREILDWIRANPGAARDLTARRLRDTTRHLRCAPPS